MGREEIGYLKKYFSVGMDCLKLFFSTKSKTAENLQSKDSMIAENKDRIETKEIIEMFAGSFVPLNSSLLRYILYYNLDTLIELCVQDTSFMQVITFFLTHSSKLSEETFDILMSYLMSNLSCLSDPPVKKGSHESSNGQRSPILLRLFKITLGSMSTYPSNELLLRPRLRPLIQLCLKYTQKARMSVNFYFIFKTLFKSLSSSQFERSHREIADVVPNVLQGLMMLLERTKQERIQSILIEICLTVPAKADVISQFFPDLLNLVIRALNTKFGELPMLGLRVFESWIEHLSPANLKTLLSSHVTSQGALMRSLYSHLRPAPYPYGMLALRILGKLGGLNRSFMKNEHIVSPSSMVSIPQNPVPLNVIFSGTSKKDVTFASSLPAHLLNQRIEVDISRYVEASCEFLLNFSNKAPVDVEVLSLQNSYSELTHVATDVSGERPASIGKGVKSLESNSQGSNHNLADKAIMKICGDISQEINYLNSKCIDDVKKSALHFVLIALASSDFFYNVSTVKHEDSSSKITIHTPTACSLPQNTEGLNLSAWNDECRLSSNDTVCSRLVVTILVASVDPSLHEKATVILNGICHHFALIYRHAKGNQNQLHRIFNIMNHCIITVISDFRPAVYCAASSFFHHWIKCLSQTDYDDSIPSEESKVIDLENVFDDLLSRAEAYCQSYKKESRFGSLRLINELTDIVYQSWCVKNEHRILMSIFSIFQSTDLVSSINTVQDCWDVLKKILLVCHTNESSSGEDDGISAMETNTPAPTIQDVLLEALISSFANEAYLIRDISKVYLQEICRLRGVSLVDLLLSKTEFIKQLYSTYDLYEDTSRNKFGALCFVCYFMESRTNIIPIDSAMMKTLQLITTKTMEPENKLPPHNSIHINDIDDLSLTDSHLYISSFPADIPTSVELRYYSLCLIRSFFQSGSTFSTDDSFQQLRSACVSTILDSILGDWVHVRNEAQKGLLSASSSNITADIQNITDNIMSYISDYRHLKLANLNLIERILLVTTAVPTLEISSKLLYNLKFWTNPSIVMNMKSYTPSEEQDVAAKMIDLFNYLPFTQQLNAEQFRDFFVAFVDIMVDLESVRHQFANQISVNSVYLSPFARFLSKYPQQGVEVLFSNNYIKRYDVVTLLVDTIQLKDDVFPFLQYLVSHEGSQRIVHILALPFTYNDSHKRPLTDNDELHSKRMRTHEETSFRTDDVKEEAPPANEQQNMEIISMNESAGDNSITANDECLYSNDMKLHTLKVVRALMSHCIALADSNHMILSSLQNLWHVINDILASEISHKSFINAHKIEDLYKKQKIAICTCECLVLHCRLHRDDIKTLISLSRICNVHLPFECPLIVDVFTCEIPATWSNASKRSIIRYFFPLLKDANFDVKMKSKILQMLISPILFQAFSITDAAEKEQLIDDEMIKIIMNDGLGACDEKVDIDVTKSEGEVKIGSTDVSQSDDVVSKNADNLDSQEEPKTRDTQNTQSTSSNDVLKVELLKVVTLTIEHLGTQLIDHRKDLIKFAWNHLKADDTATKNWAYVNVCRFIAVYETPPKIIIQVYVALLRTLPTDCKELVRIAIDILLPALPQRLTAADYVKAIKWTKKVLADEGYNVQQLIHVWNVIIRHSEFYYPYRNLLITPMVSSISKLGLMSSCPTEYRQVSVGICDVILGWEVFRQSQRPQCIATTSEDDKNAKMISDGRDDEYTLSANMVQSITNFLLRLGPQATDKDPIISRLSSACVSLFSKLVKLYPMASVRMNHLEMIIKKSIEAFDTKQSKKGNDGGKNADNNLSNEGQGDQKNSSSSSSVYLSDAVLLISGKYLLTMLECSDGTSPFITQNLTLIRNYLPLWLNSDNLQILSCFECFICKLMELFPPPMHSLVDGAQLYSDLRNMLDKAIIRATHDLDVKKRYGGDSKSPTQPEFLKKLELILIIFNSICSKVPSWVDNHGSALIKLSQCLLSEHLKQVTNSQRSGQNALMLSLQEHGQHVDFSRVSPTPHMAVISDSFAGLSPVNIDADNLISCLFVCFQVLFQAFERGYLEQCRHGILGLISTTLDNSDNCVLLNMIVGRCFPWIRNAHSPLSVDEQNQILMKLGTFEKLQETNVNSLQLRVLTIVEECFDNKERISRLERSTANSIPDHLDVLGLLSTHLPIRERTRSRLQKNWGLSVHDNIIGILGSNCALYSCRYWLSCIPALLLHCIAFDHDLDFISNQRSQSSKETITRDHHIPNGHVYSKFVSIMKEAVIDKYSFISSIDDLSLSYFQCGDSVTRQLMGMIWNNSDDEARINIKKALVDNTIRNIYRQSINWPSYFNAAMSFEQYFDDVYDNNFINVQSLATQSWQLPSNLPQGLIRHMMSVTPTPDIAVEYLGSMSHNYGTSFESLSLLQSYEKKVKEVTEKELIKSSIFQILRHDIEDQDVMLAFSTLNASTKLTEKAITYELYGYQESARRTLHNAMEIFNTTVEDSHVIPQFEVQVWEDRWINVSQKLSQWQQLYDYSYNLGLLSLNMESAAMLSNWNRVRELRMTPSVVAQLEKGTSKFKLIDIMLAVVDGNTVEADKLCAQSVQMALVRWNMLPRIHPSSIVHKTLLSQFHQIVELRESTNLIMEIKKNGNRAKDFDLRNSIRMWKKRLPNKWESLKEWDSILLWRNDVFSNIEKNFKNEDTRPMIKDTTWTTLKLADISSRHDVISLSEKYLKGIDSNDKRESFNICRQRMLNFCRNKKHNEGIKYFNSLSMASFEWGEVAEMMHLKAHIQNDLEYYSEAQQSLSRCLQCSKGAFGKGWLTWGRLLLHLIECGKHGEDISNEEIKQMIISSVTCIVQAILTDIFKARYEISRVLLVLSKIKVDQSSSDVAEELGRCLSQIPTYMWLPYHDYLLLLKDKYSFATEELLKLVTSFPQYAVSEILAKNKETYPNEVNKLSDALKHLHWHQFNLYTLFSESVAQDLCPQFIEILIPQFEGVIYHVLNDCSVRSSDKIDVSIVEKVANSLTVPMDLIHYHFKESRETVLDQMKLELSPDICNQYSTSMYVQLLMKWTSILRQILSEHTVHNRKCLRLSKIHLGSFSCRLLHDTNKSRFLEIPGLYNRYFTNPSVDVHPTMVKIGPSYSYIRKNSQICRQIKILGSDGNTHVFTFVKKDKMIDDCVASRVVSMVNGFMDEFRLTKSRDMTIQNVTSVTCARKGCTLISDSIYNKSMFDVFEAHCHCLLDEGADINLACKIRERIEEHIVNEECNVAEAIKRTYAYICNQDGDLCVENSILSDYISRTHNTAESKYLFERHLISQSGITSMLQFFVGTHKVNLHQLQFNTLSGNVHVLDIFDSSHFVRPHENAEHDTSRMLPFRLSRNLLFIIRPEFMKGLFSVSFGTSIAAIVNYKEILRSFLVLQIHASNPNLDVMEIEKTSDYLINRLELHSPGYRVSADSPEAVSAHGGGVNTSGDDSSCDKEVMALLNRSIHEDAILATIEGELFPYHPWF